MASTNQGWYDKNASRNYPIDETAACVDDAGVQIPAHVLADLRVRFPRNLATHAFIGGLTVTDRLISLIVLGADNPDAVSGYVPLAAVTVRRPADIYRMYQLTALSPGVAGWVVFGSAAVDGSEYRGVFSSPAQSRLLGRAARSYRPMPIPSIGKLGNQAALMGLVRLRGGSDIEIVGGCVAVPGLSSNDDATMCQTDDPSFRKCAIIRLKGGPRESTNLLAKYVGPCGRRPESGTCTDPQPVETISGVGPDADGTVVIEFRGWAALSEITEQVTLDDSGEVVSSSEAVGVLIDSALSLADTCGARTALPDATGRLPTEIDDLCEVSSMALDVLSPESLGCVLGSRLPPRLDQTHRAAYVDTSLPVFSWFESGGTVPGASLFTGWRLPSGSWLADDWNAESAYRPYDVRPGAGQTMRTAAASSPLEIDVGYGEALFARAADVNPLYKTFETKCYLLYSARLIFGYGESGEYHFVELVTIGDGVRDVGVYYGYRDPDGVETIINKNTNVPFYPGASVRLFASIYGDPDTYDPENLDDWNAVYAVCGVESLPNGFLGKASAELSAQTDAYLELGGPTYCLPQGFAGVATSKSDTVFYEFAIKNIHYPGDPVIQYPPGT